MRSVSRDELYEQVWSRPMTKVAAEYGVTGTALKKTCDRHEIPTPERGYWAKLEHGKPVHKEPLPKLADGHLAQIRIVGNAEQRLPEGVRQAKVRARQRLEGVAASQPTTAASVTIETQVVENPILAATRRAISRGRPDKQGFAAAQGRGVVPLKIAPASIDRGLRILSQLFALAKTQGHRPGATDTGLVLVVEDESIAFGLEEQPEKTPHEPTAAELKSRDKRVRWGLSSTPWPKYDHAPSGRLAIVIQSNSYSGLRRTYSDRKARTLEEMLPEVLAGFVEHAAFTKECRRADEERKRQWEEAETRRRREEAFKAREKRRMEFVDAIHEQLTQRAKLSAVLAHLESAADDEAGRTEAITAWVRQRIQQIEALISPLFLDISARFAKADFEEPRAEAKAEGADGCFAYLPSVELRFWSIDEEKELAISRTALEWAVEAGLAPELQARSTKVNTVRGGHSP